MKPPTQEDIFVNSSDSTIENESVMRIYTDGSKSLDGVGAAYTVWKNATMIGSWACPLDENTSIFKAELIAIKAAAQEATVNQENDIVIITDSLAVVSALK